MTIPWDVEEIKRSAFTHDTTASPDTITVNEAGLYRVTVTIAMGSSAQRASVLTKLRQNGVDLDGESMGGYIRSQDGHNESSTTLTKVIDCSAGDTIQVTAQQAAVAGTVNLRASQSVLLIEKL